MPPAATRRARANAQAGRRSAAAATVRTVRPVRVTTTARSRKYMAVWRSSNERRVRTESDAVEAVEACDAGTAMVILPPGRHRGRSITDCPGTRCCTGNGDHDFAARPQVAASTADIGVGAGAPGAGPLPDGAGAACGR